MFSENKKFSRTLRKISELCALGFLDVRSIIFYVVIACALIILTPVSYSPKYVFDVVITATGEKNDQAKSSEVWLMLPDYDALSSWPAKFEMPAGWERKRDVVVSYQNQPASISFSIESGEVGSFISFAEHEYSGVANVEINGRSINLDLYSAAAGQRRIDLYQYIDYKKRNLIGAYVKLIGFFFFYFFIFFLVGLWLSLRSVSSNFVGVDEPLWKKGLLYSLPSLFVYFIVHLIYWPGQLSPDSIDQWQQIVTGVFSDNHPVVGTLIYRFVAALHGSPSAPIVFQYLLLALIVGFLLSELRKWGVRHSVVWFLAVFIPFFPANFLIATTLWKDVLYTVLCLHLLLSGFVLLRKNWVVSRGFLASVFLSALLLANVRHNGIIVAPIVLTFFGIVRFRSKVGRILFLQAGVVLALVVGAKVFMNPFLGVSSLGQHYKAQHAVHIIAGMYERGAILSESEKQILEGFMPLSEWKDKYSCQTVVPIFWAKGGRGV